MQPSMRSLISVVSGTLTAAALQETPHFAELQGRDGLACRVWKNPSSAEFATAINHAQPHELWGLRGILTEKDLYVWQSNNFLHMDYENQTGINGVKIRLRAKEVHVNHESVAFPEDFPWVYEKNSPPEIDKRRVVFAAWLKGHNRLRAIYPNSFLASWYS